MVQTVQPVEKSDRAVVSLDIPLGVTPVVTKDQFVELAAVNQDCRLELTADGALIVMPPTGSETGHVNFNLNWLIGNWTVHHMDLGLPFDSSTGFTLPNGAIRSPDASWVRRERWEAISPEEQKKFAPICPDMVIELRSTNDQLSDLQDKMREYVENGALFGVLLDPQRSIVEIYRQDRKVEVLEQLSEVDFGEVMPGFKLRLKGLI